MEKCYRREVSSWYLIHVLEQLHCQLHYFSCMCHTFESHTFEIDFSVDIPASIFFLLFFSFSPSFYFIFSHPCAISEPSIPLELVLDQRTLTVVSNMIHEWKPS